VPHDGDAETVQERKEDRRVLRPGDRDRPTVGTGDRECDGVAPKRARIVEQQPDADGRLCPEPRFERGDPIPCMDLDTRRVIDGGGQGGRQIGRPDRRRGRAGAGVGLRTALTDTR